MNIGEVLGFVNGMAELRSKPELLSRAAGGFITKLILDEAMKSGPSPAFIEKYIAVGFTEQEVRQLHAAVLTDAIGGTESEQT